MMVESQRVSRRWRTNVEEGGKREQQDQRETRASSMRLAGKAVTKAMNALAASDAGDCTRLEKLGHQKLDSISP
ncbi:hypothetical protein HYALB_00012048 [Hymenoscyphus albidus]|uniref:Uncharacterized protein n=1 Tax=Hymenoscyphus albidus TaxID=595503 RepID=A0A9N9LVG1_9HELO|nr:hypothetical protein HYALB_00012048 [Hymenoscyphus albidus]